ncbi:BTB/POZ domain and ankyrin repeat-containing protein NBCL-like isoform X2 [Nicotiana tabacum]|uniref:BTB/POZ domain and ankyrin repeat-containing protein NBCL-like isoform X2 n=1 Tax=Nicotiana tabacum TaxID=4097 RepID=A0A1S4AJV2_TOBAC|nr:PREDICTED: regulatory protein NPR5-like isoform X2 [Nicotiana tabacum]
MTPEDSLRTLSSDYLNLLINGQAFSDVTFSVEGRLVHAHKCILAARSLFFRKFFCGPESPGGSCGPRISPFSGGLASSPRGTSGSQVIPVNTVGYEVFLLMLQFLYSGQVSIVPQKHEPRPNCGERSCWHTHCTSAVDLALDTLAAARSFGVEQLALLTQKQLTSMVEKASIEDVMKVLIASRKQDMHQLWTSCSHLVAKSGLPPEILVKHLPIDVVAKIEDLRLKSSISRTRSLIPHHHHHEIPSTIELEDHKIRRMRRALDSSDVELVKLMVMGEGLNLDESLALHYAVENCSREVVKALLELGAADVNYQAGPNGKSSLHLAAEMVSPDMVAVLLDHHADPNVQTMDGITPLDILRTLTSDFLFKGAIPGLTHIEPNKLRLCLELVQSAAMVISREEGEANNNPSSDNIYPPHVREDHSSSTSSGNNNLGNLNVDSRMVYLNLGAAPHHQMACKMNEGDQHDCSSSHNTQNPASMYHHHHSHEY